MTKKTKDEEIVRTRVRRAYELGNTGGNIALWRSALSELRELIRDESVEVRRAAASGLEQLWWTGDDLTIFALSQVLKNSNEDSEVRSKVALALAEYIPVLDKSPGANLKSIKGIRQDALDILIETLKEADLEVVEYAVVALGNIQDQNTVTPMINALQNRSVQVLETAIQAIDRLEPTAVRSKMRKALEELLDTREEEQ